MEEKKVKKATIGNELEKYRMKEAAVYIRVSTTRENQLRSVDNQISKLVRYVNEEYLLHLNGIYVDIGSGREEGTRKELKRLIEDCKRGKIDVIVTKSVSRFGRNTIETLKTCRELRGYGIDVYFQNEDIHSKGEDGELTLTIASAIAESESYEKSESIKWGIRRSAEKASSKIYSRVCYGYKKDGEGKLRIDEAEAEVVRQIYRMYIDGAGSQRIKEELEKKGIKAPSGGQKWPKRTIEKILENEKYTGSVTLYKTYMEEYPGTRQIKNNGQKDKLRVENHHEGIISQEMYEEAQREMGERKRKKDAR